MSCFWESTAPNLSIDWSVSSRKGFLKPANANTGTVRHFILSSWNAARVSGSSPSEWDLLKLAVLPLEQVV